MTFNSRFNFKLSEYVGVFGIYIRRVIDCNEWKTEKCYDCTNMRKVKWLELWWQLYVMSLAERYVWNIRSLDFWTECTSYTPSIIINTATHYQRFGFQLSCYLLIFLWLKCINFCAMLLDNCEYGYTTAVCSYFPSLFPYLFSYQTISKLFLITSLWFQMVKFSSGHTTVPLVQYHE